MSSVLYLEQFIESLEPLPGELRKNFYDMREMDEKVEVQKAMAESMADVRPLGFPLRVICILKVHSRSIIEMQTT